MANLSPHSTLVEFPLFPILPPELRLMIWSQAAQVGRIIEIRSRIDRGYPKKYWTELAVPALLQVSKEARKEGLMSYKFVELLETIYRYDDGTLSDAGDDLESYELCDYDTGREPAWDTDEEEEEEEEEDDDDDDNHLDNTSISTPSRNLRGSKWQKGPRASPFRAYINYKYDIIYVSSNHSEPSSFTYLFPVHTLTKSTIGCEIEHLAFSIDVLETHRAQDNVYLGEFLELISYFDRIGDVTFVLKDMCCTISNGLHSKLSEAQQIVWLHPRGVKEDLRIAMRDLRRMIDTQWEYFTYDDAIIPDFEFGELARHR